MSINEKNKHGVMLSTKMLNMSTQTKIHAGQTQSTPQPIEGKVNWWK